MDYNRFHWGLLVYWTIKLLKIFGVIPGAIAARWVQKLYPRYAETPVLQGGDVERGQRSSA